MCSSLDMENRHGTIDRRSISHDRCIVVTLLGATEEAVASEGGGRCCSLFGNMLLVIRTGCNNAGCVDTGVLTCTAIGA